ncbi:MAG: hypothetical protein E3J72_20965 [Planctomycetota bacterium]|nr:MAG: hypothetical protein E3J72_20965 [Planctomycetota bacterium]
MAIKTKCTKCGQALSVQDNLHYKSVRCPGCGKKSKIYTLLEQKQLALEAVIKREEIQKRTEITDKKAFPRFAVLAVASLLLLGILIGGFLYYRSKRNAEREKDEKAWRIADAKWQEENGEITEIIIPDYKILDDDIEENSAFSFMGPSVYVTLHVLVKGELSNESLTKLLAELVEKAKSKAPNKLALPEKRYFINLYSKEHHYDEGSGDRRTMVEYIRKINPPSEDRESIWFQPELYRLHNAKPEVMFGLTEKKRMELFKEILNAQWSAEDEAKKKYWGQYEGNKRPAKVKKDSEFFNEIIEEYNNNIINKWGIKVEHIEKVYNEGIDKYWPKPIRYRK